MVEQRHEYIVSDSGSPSFEDIPAIVIAVIIRCHHTCAVALGAFHLDAGGEGAVGTICKVGFINCLLYTSRPVPS